MVMPRSGFPMDIASMTQTRGSGPQDAKRMSRVVLEKEENPGPRGEEGTSGTRVEERRGGTRTGPLLG